MTKISKTRKIAFTAAFVALNVVANSFSIQLFGTSNYLTFTYLICFLSGIYLGPVSGLTVGILGDVLGHLLFPKGAFNPLIMIASGLLGLIPALIWKTKLRAGDKLLLSTIVCAIVCTAGINTYAIWLYLINRPQGYENSFWVYLSIRLPFQLMVVTVNYVLTYAVLRIKVLDKLFFTRSDSVDQSSIGSVNVIEDNKIE